MKCIILTGMPCSGKSSVGTMANKAFNLPYLSSGDIARRMAKEDKSVENLLNIGCMAPEESMRQCIYDALTYEIDGNEKAVIIDGFPRNVDQLHWLREQFHDLDLICIHISVPIPVAQSRNELRNRDDSVAFNSRLHTYIDTTYKMVSKFRKSHVVNNDGDINTAVLRVQAIIQEEVFEDVNNRKLR